MNSPFPFDISLPGTSVPSVPVDVHTLASSIFAVNGPYFSGPKVTRTGVLRKSVNNKSGKRLHHLMAHGPTMWEFQSYDHLKEYLENNGEEDTLYGVLARSNLIESAKLCHRCGRSMQLRSRHANQKYMPIIEWRCRSHSNGKKIDCSTQSFRNRSIFQTPKMDLHSHLQGLFSWLNDNGDTKVMDQRYELTHTIAKSISEGLPLGGVGHYVDFVVIPDGPAPSSADTRLVMFVERRPDGRVAADLILPGESYLFAFAARWLVPGTILVAKSDEIGLLHFTNWPKEKRSSVDGSRHPSMIDEFERLLAVVSTKRKTMDSSVVNETVVRFNRRSNFPFFFWSLLSANNIPDVKSAIA